MPRYHKIVLAYEGECSQCGGCCVGCSRLGNRRGVKVCRDHGKDKPSHCILFPIGYAVELIPKTCTLVPTEIVEVDETVHTHRIRVSGRTGVALFDATREDGDDGEPPKSLYDLQGQIESGMRDRLYERTPEQHLKDLAGLIDQLRSIEVAEGDGPDSPLSWDGDAMCEDLVKVLITTANLYATRRDVIIGDLFAE